MLVSFPVLLPSQQDIRILDMGQTLDKDFSTKLNMEYQEEKPTPSEECGTENWLAACNPSKCSENEVKVQEINRSSQCESNQSSAPAHKEVFDNKEGPTANCAKVDDSDTIDTEDEVDDSEDEFEVRVARWL